MSIGENIKKLRKIYGLSQRDIAEIAGVSDKAVSTWENDLKEPRMGTIQRLADHFNLQKSNIIEDNGLAELFGSIHDIGKNFKVFQSQFSKSDNIIRKIRNFTPENLEKLERTINFVDGDANLVIDTLTIPEHDILKKYRALDERGKIAVETILDSQYNAVFPKTKENSAEGA